MCKIIINNNPVYIYVLRDPNTNEVRYVGKTINIKKRRGNHIRQLKNLKKSNNKCNAWTNSMIKKGTPPIFEVVEKCNQSTWSIAEKSWIKKFDNLLNMTEGGDSSIVIITDKHISKRLKGKKLSDVYSEEKVKELLLNKSINSSGEKNPNFGGKLQTEEYMLKQSLSNSKKPILVIDTLENKEYKFINSGQAGEFLNCDPKNIRYYKNKNWKIKRRYLIKDFN
jgi:group I intron endonuclease